MKTSHSLSLALLKLILIFDITREIQNFTQWPKQPSYIIPQAEHIASSPVFKSLRNHEFQILYASWSLIQRNSSENTPIILELAYWKIYLFPRLKDVGPYPSLSHFVQHIQAIFVADLSQTAGVKITLGHWHLRNWKAFMGYKRPISRCNL